MSNLKNNKILIIAVVVVLVLGIVGYWFLKQRGGNLGIPSLNNNESMPSEQPQIPAAPFVPTEPSSNGSPTQTPDNQNQPVDNQVQQ